MSYQQNALVDEYVEQFDGDIKKRLVWLRSAIQAAFTSTIEDMSYGMPTYRPAPGRRGIIHFAVAKDHIGLYAVIDPDPKDAIYEKLTLFKTGRGTLQFKNADPFPSNIILEILTYHAKKALS